MCGSIERAKSSFGIARALESYPSIRLEPTALTSRDSRARPQKDVASFERTALIQRRAPVRRTPQGDIREAPGRFRAVTLPLAGRRRSRLGGSIPRCARKDQATAPAAASTLSGRAGVHPGTPRDARLQQHHGAHGGRATLRHRHSRCRTRRTSRRRH